MPLFRLPALIGLALASLTACFPDVDPAKYADTVDAAAEVADAQVDSADAPESDAVLDVADGLEADAPDGSAPDAAVGPDAGEVSDGSMQDSDQPVLLAPTEVYASVDRAESVEVRWEAAEGATAYHVERCDGADCAAEGAWTRLTAAPTGGLRLVDEAVEVPFAPPAPEAVVASVDRPEEVAVSWAEVEAPAPRVYAYRVVAVGADGVASAPSGVAVGHVAERPVEGYEVQVDGEAWRAVASEGATAWVHLEAAPPTLRAGTVVASEGLYAEFVRLSLSGYERRAGETHRYRVRAVTAYGPAAASAEAEGYRAAGPLSLTWERSEGTAPAGFGALLGATGAAFDDAGAPADGSVRWYRAVISAPGAATEATEPAAGSRQPPPGVPGAVVASSDLEGHVLVTWSPVASALGYRVYRDGALLTPSGPIAGTSFEDTTAPPPAGAWPAPTALTASTGHSDKVTLAWVTPQRPLGSEASYQVRAVNAAGDGPLSAAASGRRAGPALESYEVEATPIAGTASYFGTGSLAPAWTHADPPWAVIAPGSIAASAGDYRGFVRLTSSGASVGAAPSVSYRVRGLLVGGGRTPLSSAAVGRRAVGALTRQWQRSTSAGGASYVTLSGATGLSLDDASASATGAKRNYKLVLAADGAEARAVGPVEGWRLALAAVDGGESHTCALATDGTVWCWGGGSHGQLGRGAFEGDTPLSAGRVPGLAGVVAIHAGRNTSCARTGAGQTWCWGGEFLGDGLRRDAAAPVQIAGLAGAVDLTFGESHGCAVYGDGAVKCWGSADGRVGDGTWEERLAPVRVKIGAATYLTGATHVSTAWAHTCARLGSGQVWCWGFTEGGRLGVMPSACESTQCLVAYLATSVSGVVDVTVSAEASFARTAAGSLLAWGVDGFGIRGDGPTSSEGPTPTSVAGLTSAAQLSSAWMSACARLTAGPVWCWGRNDLGELGAGLTQTSATTPVAVNSPVSQASSIGSGDSHHCAVQGGDAYCWGANWSQQLGLATSHDPVAGKLISRVPVKVMLP